MSGWLDTNHDLRPVDAEHGRFKGLAAQDALTKARNHATGQATNGLSVLRNRYGLCATYRNDANVQNISYV
jgi:hypothetical protein